MTGVIWKFSALTKKKKKKLWLYLMRNTHFKFGENQPAESEK